MKAMARITLAKVLTLRPRRTEGFVFYGSFMMLYIQSVHPPEDTAVRAHAPLAAGVTHQTYMNQLA